MHGFISSGGGRNRNQSRIYMPGDGSRVLHGYDGLRFRLHVLALVGCPLTRTHLSTAHCVVTGHRQLHVIITAMMQREGDNNNSKDS